MLGKIREDGYLVGESDITSDLRILAVPVLGPDGWGVAQSAWSHRPHIPRTNI